MNIVKLSILKRVPRTMRYVAAGHVDVPCTVEQTFGENPSIPRLNCIVRLLQPGAGYKAGHLLQVGSNQVSVR